MPSPPGLVLAPPGPVPRRDPASRLALGLCLAAVGCVAPEDVSSLDRAIAVTGPWQIPAATLARGDTQFVTYTGAGPWVGESGCGGSFLAGTQILEDWVLTWFPQVSTVGGYSCRPIVGNDAQMSVHATGRAIDIMIPTDGGEADNGAGDPLGNYLVEHAEEMGIQYVIWDRWQWNASRQPGDKDRYYSGEHPHHDHLHVELSVAAANKDIPWYQGGDPPPPDLPPCGTIPPAGAVIDDREDCARAFGPERYWRVEDVGHGGHLRWTDAYQGADPSNWARFELHFDAAGQYEVEYHSVGQFAVFDAVRYEIVHRDQTETLAVDQAGRDGWMSLGTFGFARGGEQSVSLFDNAPAPVADGQRIVFDALRIRPAATGPDDPPPAGGDEGGGEPAPDEDSGEDLSGGCRVAAGAGGGAGGGTTGAAALLALALAGRVRRRR